MEKNLISKKNTTMGFKWCFDPIVVIFFKSKFFHFQKDLQVLADPVVVIFFKKCQKNYKCWIKCISKKFTTTGSANTCKFFWKWKNFDFKKNYNYGIKAPLKSHSCIFFFEIKFFSFSKKITSVGWSSRCNFFWNALDPTLKIFFISKKKFISK